SGRHRSVPDAARRQEGGPVFAGHHRDRPLHAGHHDGARHDHHPDHDRHHRDTALMLDSEFPHSWMTARIGAGSPPEPSPMPPASLSGFVRRPASAPTTPTSTVYSKSNIS